MLDLERLERLLEYDTEKSKLRPPRSTLTQPSSPKGQTAALPSRRSLPDTFSTGGDKYFPLAHPEKQACTAVAFAVEGGRGAGGSYHAVQALQVDVCIIHDTMERCGGSCCEWVDSDCLLP